MLGEKNKGKDIWLLVWSPLPCLGASTWQMFKVKCLFYRTLHFLTDFLREYSRAMLVVWAEWFVMQSLRFRELQLAK